MYLISACLCGVNCKYSGSSNFNEKALKLFNRGEAILVCPEVLGGLTTPRLPAEINLGKTAEEVLKGKANVINNNGQEVTEKFLLGANKVLQIAQKLNIKKAILKSGSPSCGFNEVYDGSFSGKKVKGNGVTTELLIKNGIKVITEVELEENNEF